MKLIDKVAIVTGGGRDIGRAISLKLAAEGAKIAINFSGNEVAAQQTLEEVQAAGGTAILVQGDMTRQQDVDNLVAQSQKAFGERIDILANVVGGLVARKTIDEIDEAFFNLVIRLNLNSAFLVTKAVVPHMPEGSAIVNLASQAGRDGGGPGASAYAASKGALMTLTRAWAKEFGPRGIRVNALCPGVISTSFHDIFTREEVRKNIASATPLRREGMASEVGNIVAFLSSSEASFLTGLNLDVNGGLLFS